MNTIEHMRHLKSYIIFESNTGFYCSPIFKDTFCDISDDLPVNINYSDSELPGYQGKIVITHELNTARVDYFQKKLDLFKLLPIMKSKIGYLKEEGFDFDISLSFLTGRSSSEHSWYLSSFNINDLEPQVIYGTYKILIYIFK